MRSVGVESFQLDASRVWISPADVPTSISSRKRRTLTNRTPNDQRIRCQPLRLAALQNTPRMADGIRKQVLVESAERRLIAFEISGRARRYSARSIARDTITTIAGARNPSSHAARSRWLSRFIIKCESHGYNWPEPDTMSKLEQSSRPARVAEPIIPISSHARPADRRWFFLVEHERNDVTGRDARRAARR
jgi:hypothetical protein